MPFALSLLAAFLSMWIVIPGPTIPLFVLTVACTENWPILAIIDGGIFVMSLRMRGRLRRASILIALAALLCTLLPPLSYALHGPRVPLIALLTPWPWPAHRIAAGPRAPVVAVIYGGAWERGSPKNDARLNAIIASWGYRIVALDYPHAPGARWPAQRIAILKQIDALPPGPLAVLGHSSGAQLAIIAASLRPHRIRAVITYESPVDLRLGYEYPPQPDVVDLRHVLRDLCGGTPEQRPACYRSASPRYAVRAGMPPILMIAAGRDHVVPLGFEHLLRDKLRGDGVNVTYVELPWADHAFEYVATGFHDRIALWYLRRFLNARLSGTVTKK